MKTFLGIGTGAGIGFATAERFAREGFRVVLSARNLERTRELAKRLINMADIEVAFTRMQKSDVKYRFVIDMATL